MKRVAIYSRKSKFTGKGDSIENHSLFMKMKVFRAVTLIDQGLKN